MLRRRSAAQFTGLRARPRDRRFDFAAAPGRATFRLMSRRNWLEASGPDRRAELRPRAEAIRALFERDDVRILGLVDGRLLTEERVGSGLVPRELRREEIRSAEPLFLGVHDERPIFAADLSEPEASGEAGHVSSSDLRRVGPLLSEADASQWAYARALTWWHRRHPFCPVCGAPTRVVDAGHRRICTAETCGAEQHPRTDPAVIVLVHRGNRCLLARSPRFPPKMLSTLAGFVEPGESLDDCVRREVFEEVGVRVGEVRYHSSQPWPFPQSLMIGFLAAAENEDLVLDETEIEAARWVDREVVADPDRWADFVLPPPFAIARRLVQSWVEGASSD
jgi:NAD+ diphosphatase